MNIADIIGNICKESHVPLAESVFGNDGVDAIFNVMNAVTNLYKAVELERITGRVIVFQTLPLSVLGGSPVDLNTLSNQEISNLVLQLSSDGRMYICNFEGKSLKDLAQNAVVYSYQAEVEEFLVGTERKIIPRYETAARSQFCIPTLSTLREALDCFARECIRESSSYIFRKVWFDENRLFLKAKPESIMRDALTEFLRNRLGADHDVFPEQNVDESHPVDIRVHPRLNKRLMIIEIKWLGDSVRSDGKITTPYRDSRAQAGAKQLSDYLDSQLQSAPNQVVHGYYVIIDARRRGLNQGDTSIDRDNGMYYENMELSFDPAPHETRDDFDPPFRMFVRPICEI